MYKPIPRSEILDALVHLRDLHRQIKPTNEQDLLVYERREAATRDSLSNLPRVSRHPTLRTLLEIADIFRLTLDGAHRLFGYDLDEVREYDLRLNGGRTHIIESYPFNRDLPVDLPSQLATREAFSSDALLRDLVTEWRTNVPIRALGESVWHHPATFYVHVGTEESLGFDIPPGALAMVTPIEENERMRPNPRGIYLLQFGNRYADECDRHPCGEVETKFGSRPVQRLINRQRSSSLRHGRASHRLTGKRPDPTSTPTQDASTKQGTEETCNGILKAAAQHPDSGKDKTTETNDSSRVNCESFKRTHERLRPREIHRSLGMSESWRS